MKSAIVTGLTGQSAPYLCKLLLSKDYLVYGVVRDTSRVNFDFINEMGLEKVEIINGDLTDDTSLFKMINKIKPNEFYNLAGLSSIASSFEQPEQTLEVTGLGPVRILEAIRQCSPKTRFYQAGSSEQKDGNPESPYAAAKVLAHNMIQIYRRSYGLHASVGILSNHESERRGLQFVSRKITDYVGRFVHGKTKLPLLLGNLNAKRDFAHAEDMVRGQYLILQQEKPDDYVLCTGQLHTIREFVTTAFKAAEVKIHWQGDGLLEEGIDEKTGNLLVAINNKYYRPIDSSVSFPADFSKAKSILGWEPLINFEELVYRMVNYDIERYKNATIKNY